MQAINKRTNCSADMSAEKGKTPWRDRARFRTRVAVHGTQVRGGDVTCADFARRFLPYPAGSFARCRALLRACAPSPSKLLLFSTKSGCPAPCRLRQQAGTPSWLRCAGHSQSTTAHRERQKAPGTQCVGGPCQRLASESVAIIGAPCSRIRLRAAHKQCGRACS